MRALQVTIVSSGAPEKPAVMLSPSEVAKEIQALSSAEKTRLMKVAALYARTTPYSHEDLFQEALCRVLRGDRAWRRDLPAQLFLQGVVRSIAWEWRTKTPPAPVAGVDIDAAERGAMARLDVAKIIALFDDDPTAQKILTGMMEGLRGEELRQSAGVDPTTFDSKCRKVRRRLEKVSW